MGINALMIFMMQETCSLLVVAFMFESSLRMKHIKSSPNHGNKAY